MRNTSPNIVVQFYWWAWVNGALMIVWRDSCYRRKIIQYKWLCSGIWHHRQVVQTRQEKWEFFQLENSSSLKLTSRHNLAVCRDQVCFYLLHNRCHFFNHQCIDQMNSPRSDISFCWTMLAKPDDSDYIRLVKTSFSFRVINATSDKIL